MNKNLRYNFAPQMKIYDKIGHKFLPYAMFTQTPNFRSKVLNTDDRGFRYNSNFTKKSIFEETKKDNTVLLLGGSTAFGVGATSDQNTVSGYLEKKLDYNFLNLSGRAFTGFQEIISTLCNIEDLEKLTVKKIIIFSGINDIYLSSISDLKYPGMFFFNSEFLGKFDKIKSYKKSLLIHLIKLIIPDSNNYDLDKLDKNNFLKFLINKNFRKKLNDDYSFKEINLENIIKRNFLIYKFFEKIFNCEVIFVFQPFISWCKDLTNEEKTLLDFTNKFDNGKNNFSYKFLEENKKFIEITRNISKSNKINFYDLNEFFKKEDINKKWLFLDRVHLNNEGYELTSEYIKNILEH
jgi:hypothetical protein